MDSRTIQEYINHVMSKEEDGNNRQWQRKAVEVYHQKLLEEAFEL
jgi:hypothetical protein